MAQGLSRDGTTLGAGALLSLALAATATAGCGGATHEAAASDAGDGAACEVVVASDYDQSCTVDTDCVAVGEVSQCPASACDNCTTEAINTTALEKYMTALALARASVASGQLCGCPCEGGAICRGGVCQAAYCGPPSSDTLPLCANAGGRCAYSANTKCNSLEEAGACAYADELCCLQ